MLPASTIHPVSLYGFEILSMTQPLTTQTVKADRVIIGWLQSIQLEDKIPHEDFLKPGGFPTVKVSSIKQWLRLFGHMTQCKNLIIHNI